MCQLRLMDGVHEDLTKYSSVGTEGSLRSQTVLGYFKKDISLQDASVKYKMGHLLLQEMTYQGDSKL